MKFEYDKEIHLNSNGDPDIDYYMKQARKMRNEMILGVIRTIAARLKHELDTLQWHFHKTA